MNPKPIIFVEKVIKDGTNRHGHEMLLILMELEEDKENPWIHP